MSESLAININGKSIEHVLQKACEHFKTTESNLSYELISQTNAGFLSFLGGKKVELKVWPKPSSSSSSSRRQSARRSHNNPTTEVAEEVINREPLSPEVQAELITDLSNFCSGICEFLVNRKDIPVSAAVEGDKLCLNIDDEEISSLINANSRLAESLEHLLRKKPRHLKRELPFRIFVDAKGTRVLREVELVEMAKNLCAQVTESQKPIVLNYKSSYDRKIIHMALEGSAEVYTKSIGTGANRKLMILPQRTDGAAEHRS